MTLIAPPPGMFSEEVAQLAEPPPAAFSKQDAQALFKEARRRRRQRWLTSVLVLALVTAGVLTYRSISTSGVTSGHSSNTKETPPTLAAGPFAGTWHVKYYYVRIADNGRGSATWPIKAFCGESELPPGSACDTVNPTTGETHDGGHAQIRLVSVTGSSAGAVVSGSTEPSLLPDGKALLRVASDDVVYITPVTPTFSSPFGRSSFCGPRADALSYAQQTAEHIDCGT
jgi:hypothetical protein